MADHIKSVSHPPRLFISLFTVKSHFLQHVSSTNSHALHTCIHSVHDTDKYSFIRIKMRTVHDSASQYSIIVAPTLGPELTLLRPTQGSSHFCLGRGRSPDSHGLESKAKIETEIDETV